MKGGLLFNEIYGLLIVSPIQLFLYYKKLIIEIIKLVKK